MRSDWPPGECPFALIQVLNSPVQDPADPSTFCEPSRSQTSRQCVMNSVGSATYELRVSSAQDLDCAGGFGGVPMTSSRTAPMPALCPAATTVPSAGGGRNCA